MSQVSKEVMDIEMSQKSVPGRGRPEGKGWGLGSRKGPVIKLRGQKSSLAK